MFSCFGLLNHALETKQSAGFWTAGSECLLARLCEIAPSLKNRWLSSQTHAGRVFPLFYLSSSKCAVGATSIEWIKEFQRHRIYFWSYSSQVREEKHRGGRRSCPPVCHTKPSLMTFGIPIRSVRFVIPICFLRLRRNSPHGFILVY